MHIMPPIPCLLALSALALIPSISQAQVLRERQPHSKHPVVAPPLPATMAADAPRRLVVKFADAVRARATGSNGVQSRMGVDMTRVRELADSGGFTFRPLLLVPEIKLTALEERAAANARVAQPDLAGMLIVDVPGASTAQLERIGQELQDLPIVEYAVIETLAVPPPGDLAPTTPDLTALQSYLGSNPGLDVDYAWSQGFRGAGIRFSDCEYGWNPDHEDLNDTNLNLESGQTIHPSVYSFGWDSHGTAVVGGAKSVDNAYGITGIAADADTHTYTEWSVEEGTRRATCIANAIADSSFGDVVLLEMQTTGAGGGFAPAEFNTTVWDIVKTGTDAGVIVVGAAGNGDQNLDSGAYNGYTSRGDSGAILVGAGTANTSHDKLSFSTYGSRVNVQAWGQSVFTLGYGGFAEYGGDKNQRYTSSFNGTSSAAGLTGPACAVLQSAAIAILGERLPPKPMRKLLEDTGVPQGTGGHIGPCIDLQGAILGLPNLLYAELVGSPRNGDAPHLVNFTNLSFGTATSYLWSFGDGGSSTAASPMHIYTTAGTYTVSLLITGPGGTAGATRTNYVTVTQPLTITDIDPGTIDPLIPGTAQTVSISGTEFGGGSVVEINDVPLDAASYTVVSDTLITVDMPLATLLGTNTIAVVDGVHGDTSTINITAPGAPILQMGNGEPINVQSFSSGLDVAVAGDPGALHYVLYSSSELPSVIPIIDLGIGNGFSDLFLSSTHVIGEAGWTVENLPLAGGAFALFYLQSLTLSGFPIPTSNVQSIFITPF